MPDKRVTLHMSPELAEKLRNYAYTERITIKEAVNRALEWYLKDKNNLLKKRG
ncbi:MAG: hypothetical protein J6D53_09330 [Blautia sp.]|nr:hypothetical protein [Blautia sp.]